MKTGTLLESRTAYAEVTGRQLAVLDQGTLREWPLERSDEGRLTEACRARLKSELTAVLAAPPWGARPTLRCALGGRGISIRRLALPPTSAQHQAEVLRLQIEAEFPLGPDELSWVAVPAPGVARGPAGGREELVIAVRAETVNDLAEIFQSVGWKPVFTIGAAVRATRVTSGGRWGVLHASGGELEWAWGGGTVLEGVRVFTDPGTAGLPETVRLVVQRWAADGGTLHLSGIGWNQSDRQGAVELAAPGVPVIRWGGGATDDAAAPAGLRELVSAWEARSGAVPLLPCWLPGTPRRGESATADGSGGWQRWAMLAAVLLVLAMATPLVEALLLRPRLAREVSVLKAERRTWEEIDRAYGFLRQLQQDQAPYLDALLLLARIGPGGAPIEGLSMTRRGDFVLRGSVPQSQQLVDFRTKLVESGFFSQVVVEEQTPSPDRQKVTYRIRAQLKPPAERQGLKVLADDEPGAGGEGAGGPPGGPVPPGGRRS